MTVEEAIERIYHCNGEGTCSSWKMHHCIDCNYREALNMAIRSLEAWEKVKEDIFIIQNDDNSFLNIPYLLENIINKHLQEVENGT